MGAMGATHAMWAQTLYIESTVKTGTITAELDPFVCNSYTNPDDPDSTSVSCLVSTTWVTNDTLEIEITNALWKVTINNVEHVVHYYCDYSINNTGTVPVKIQDINISGLPATGGVEVDPDVAEGDQIDPGASLPATADIWLTNTNSEGETFTVTITFTFITWHQFTP
jgi:hypothetical protein